MKAHYPLSIPISNRGRRRLGLVVVYGIQRYIAVNPVLPYHGCGPAIKIGNSAQNQRNNVKAIEITYKKKEKSFSIFAE